MSFELTVLGCSGSGPSRTVPASGYLLRSATTSIWMDAGTGTFMALAQLIDPIHLDAVVISHIHPDHCTDLFGYFHHLAYRRRVTASRPVYVAPGAIEWFAGFVEADQDHVFRGLLELNEVGEGDTATVGDLGLRFAETEHSVPCVATRIEDGDGSLVYSGDTGPGGGFSALATGADVVLCEAGLVGSRDNTTYPLHLSGGEAADIAQAGGARRLILTHLAPMMPADAILAEARARFAGPVEAASPGMVVSVPSLVAER